MPKVTKKQKTKNKKTLKMDAILRCAKGLTNGSSSSSTTKTTNPTKKRKGKNGAKKPLTGVALWKDKLWKTIYNGYGKDVHIADVMELLNEAKEANFTIDVDGLLMEDDDMNVLNTILFHSFFEDDEDDIKDLKKLLLQSKNWKRYWFHVDKVFHSPLFWIEWTDKEAAIKLLPFFKEHGHVIDNRERNILGEKVLVEWHKLSNTEGVWL